MSLTPKVAALLSALLLTACASRHPDIPEALTAPVPRPAVPSPGASDRQIGAFILAQDAALNRANAQLAAIRDIVRN